MRPISYLGDHDASECVAEGGVGMDKIKFEDFVGYGRADVEPDRLLEGGQGPAVVHAECGYSHRDQGGVVCGGGGGTEADRDHCFQTRAICC